jgi:CopG-like RHH_1 or ribbon-helix-helix domain, RHH_5
MVWHNRAITVTGGMICMQDLAIKVTKRVNISLSDGLYADLEVWADLEKSSPTALAGSLVEGAVRSAKLNGIICTRNPITDYKSFATLIAQNLSGLVESGKFESSRLKFLMEGGQPSEVELLRIALLIGVSEEYIGSLPLKDS